MIRSSIDVPMMLRRALPLVLLAFAASLFASSPEHLIGATISTPAPNPRGGAVVASDGTDFFVMWADYRSPATAAIVGTRVTRDGRVLDPLGIGIAPSSVGGPLQLVWDGGAYLAVWTGGAYENGLFRSSVYAARIDRDGRFVMQPRVVAGNGSTYGTAVASNGNVSVIAYLSTDSGTHRIAVLDRDGNTLRQESLPAPGLPIAMAATPSRFVITWSAPRGLELDDELLALALTGDGHPVGGSPVRVGFGIEPAIGTDGTNFLIVSSIVDREFSRWTVRSRAVSPELAPVGELQTLTSGFEPTGISVLWRNGRYEVIVNLRPGPSEPFEATSIDVGADGHVIATRTRDRAGSDAATNGTDVLVAFSDGVSSTTSLQLFAAVYRGDAPVAEVRELLSWSGNGHTNPVVAASAAGATLGAGHLVAWNEESGVYFTRVDAGGNSLDGRGVQLAPKGFGVRVTFDGTSYVAAWREQDAAIGVRWIAPATGATVATARLPVEAWQGMAIASSREATYVVFADDRVRVTRIPHATHTPDPVPLAVSPENVTVDALAAAWNGSMLLAVWTDVFYPRGDPPIGFARKILGARVTGGLSLLDPAPLPIVDAAGDQPFVSLGAPSVASNGDAWLVLTDDERGVLARRVLHDGTLSGNGPEPIAGGRGAAVTWDSFRYAVAWKDGMAVRLGTIAASGVLAATHQTVVATDVASSALLIAPAANGEAAVTYTKVSFRPEHNGVERTFLRFMQYGAPRGRVIRK